MPHQEALDAVASPSPIIETHISVANANGVPQPGPEAQDELQDAVSTWLREAGRVPLLSAAQEIALARSVNRGARAQTALRDPVRDLSKEQRTALRACVEDGDRAKEHLIRANLRLVVVVAKRHLRRGLSLADLIQEGNLGLLRAVERFDYRLGYKFSTYATWWIRQGISRAIADQGRAIRIPVHMMESVNRVLRAQNAVHQRSGREATAAECATETGLPLERVREVLSIIPEPMSLETPMGDSADSHLADFLVDAQAPSPVESLETHNRRECLFAAMRDILSDRERMVLSLRYGLEDDAPRTLEEVGDAVGVTRERIRQIETRALKKLRHPNNSDRLMDVLA